MLQVQTLIKSNLSLISGIFCYPLRNLIPVNAALQWKSETGDGLLY